MAIYGPWLDDAISAWLPSMKALLVTSAYTHSPDHHFRSDITGEVAGTGYTPGGVLVTGLSVTYDASTDVVVIDCTDISFGAFDSPDVAGIVFYKPVGTAGTDVVIAHDSWPAVEVTSATDFVYATSPTGLITITGGL